MSQEVKVPDIGNYANVPVIEILVAPGDTVNLLIIRGDETFEVPVVLESRPTDSPAVPDCGE